MSNIKNKIDVLDFKISGNLSEYTDSLLFDHDVIASLETNEYKVTIEIIGDKRIIFDDEVYKSACNYPEELINILKQSDYFDNDRIEIIDNNWFEIDIYERDSINNVYELIDDDVLEIDISAMSEGSLKEYMVKYLEDYLKEFSKSDIDNDMEMEEINWMN
ncbi:MAG: hypothetical protein IJJ82_07105 [Clostridia bacterium]|nr:hypothetical protein [Clostridia bacterium]